MNTNMQGHNHGGKSHLLAMVGIGAFVLVVLLLAGRSFGEALPFAFLLACPLMMIGMLYMMRGAGNSHQHGNTTPTTRPHEHDAPPVWSDSTSYTTAHPPTPADRN
ncbi:MAG: DUF2933 domain-containing protein [Cellulomonas sp.]